MLQHLLSLVADPSPAPAAPSSPTDFTQFSLKYLAQFGVFGAAFFDVFVTRKFLVPRWAKDDAVQAKEDIIKIRDETITEKNDDLKELKASLAQLQSLTRDQVLPALVRANQLSADYVQEVTRRAYQEPNKPTPRRRKVDDG